LQKDSMIDGTDLIQFCKTQLASYKVPKSVDIVTSLPHTEIGKINKVKLKESILVATAL
jgi:acyl-CoA synthetase (AMP-forming)/AMP-acid ligase II